MKQLALARWFNNVSIAKKLYFVMGTMALLIAFELFALWFSVNTLSSIRAYVGGEGLWSKSQKDAIYHLNRYANEGDEKDYRAFLDFMKIPLGDNKARVELEKETPNLAIARQGFLEGLNHPDDIDGMIKVFRRFREIYYIDKAIGIWAEADPIIGKLIPIGERLNKEITSSSPSRERINQILLEITPINQKLTQLENEFSFTLGEGSRWLENLILKILLTIALTVEFAGLLFAISISRRISKGINEVIRVAKQVAKGNFHDKAAIFSKDEIGVLAHSFNTMTRNLEQHINKLREADKKIAESEERYQQLFNNTTDLIQSISEDGKIQFVNNAWRKKLGYCDDEINGVLSIFNIVTREHRDHFINIFQSVIKDRDTQYIETEFIAKDGRKIQVEGNINCRFIGNSPTVVQCFLRDVSEQKEMQTILERKTLLIMKKTNELAEAQLKLLLSSLETDKR